MSAMLNEGSWLRRVWQKWPPSENSAADSSGGFRDLSSLLMSVNDETGIHNSMTSTAAIASDLSVNSSKNESVSDERSARPETVDRLRAAGAEVDASWEVWRLRGLAVEAQGRGRYYGLEGGDVLSYARRLAALDPGNADAASLLLKVGERMAWDAEAAMADGSPEEASGLVRSCLDLVPEHPRCLEVAGSGA